MTFTTRFAPSPTGPLHLGHAYSALIGFQRAQARLGRFLLRIEDIDQSRSRPHWEQHIYDDLTWLGIEWEKPVLRQSERSETYANALAILDKKGLTYACDCRRADIEAAAQAPQEGVPQFGPDGRIYPGTCRARSLKATDETVIRLDMRKAVAHLKELTFTENGPAHQGAHCLNPEDLIIQIGDIVLQRRGMAASYHLAVVLDDASQRITEVTRGVDLWDSTQIHVLLHHLLGLPCPQFYHHDLIRDSAGKRLAKRDDARSIATYRSAGATVDDIYAMVGLRR